VLIREATDADWPAIWPFWRRVIAAGETYSWDPATDEPTARELWMDGMVYVAVDDDGVVVGSANLKPNYGKLGDHIANASFLVDPDHAGRGIGRKLGEHVLAKAPTLGYRAIQFNAVVTTNEPAVRLWRSLGFEILATVPEAFRHPRHGLVGIHIMYRKVT